METMKSFNTQGEENTKLLFVDNFISPKLQYNIEEIFFSKAIILQQIRILKTDSNPHPKIKSMQSKTQREQIFNFDIFARNLKSQSDKFEYLFESGTVNKENGETDTIFPILSEFVTNHIVLRGKYEKITICIYGIPCSASENHQLLEAAKSEVPLEKINSNQSDTADDKMALTNDDMQMIQQYPIDALISSYINCDIAETVIQRAYYINKPNLNMIDKTKSGYIYYENDLIYYSQCLYNFYLNEHNSKKNLTYQLMDDNRTKTEMEQQENYKKVFDIVKILISKNAAYLDQDCVFRKENLEIYNKIPEIIVGICITALSGAQFGYTEVKFGLKLLKLICNSVVLVTRFVEGNGMEALYNILFIREKNEKMNNLTTVNGMNNGKNGSDYSTILKIMVLENIYRLITFKIALERFMDNIDKKKFPQQYFLIKELSKEPMIMNNNQGNDGGNGNVMSYDSTKGEIVSSKENKESKKKDKDRKDKDNDKKHKKKHKSSSKRDKSSSHSKSKSRSRSRSNSRLKEKRKNSKDSDSSQDSKSKKIKKKHKNVPIKNGYQLILTLIIGKKNYLISNIIKRIINKISILLYLQKFGQQIENINNNMQIINVDLVKVSNQLKKIFEYLNKTEISYKKSYPNDHQTFLNKDYPFTNFWIDYLKTNRKNFKKSELNNIKSTIDNEIHSSNKFNEAGIITNEIAVMLEESHFLQNLILLLANPLVQCTSQYFDLALLSKNLLGYILLSKGGINFFSKNFDITVQLITLFNLMTLDLSIEEENFFQMTLPSTSSILLNKSNFEPHKYSKVNEVIINTTNNTQFTDEYIIKVHYLQLKHLFNYSFMFLGKLDTLLSAQEENEYFIDKSLDILLFITQNITKSNLSKQSLLSFAQNDFFINELISLLSDYVHNECIEHEAHITLIIQVLFFIFTEISRTSDILLLLYGPACYESLMSLKQTLQIAYDSKDVEPINSNFQNSLEGIITFLHPLKQFTESKDMSGIMTCLNDACFSNLQKYNLNDNAVNVKDDLKEYLSEYKLNVQKHQNSDVDFLELLQNKGTLLNEIFAAVKIVNLSIRINPLLLIDCVSEHIHLTLRYLIVNTVHSIKYYLNPEAKEFETNAELGDVDKYEKLRQYSIMLYHMYDILKMLLKNLLSSHVDNYRDTIVIEKTVTLIIELINFLYDVYAGEITVKANDIEVTEYIQKLFCCVMETYAEICKFNATIMLNFKKIVEKIAERPSNKPGLIYLLNFMLNVVNNIYTIETFVDHLTKVQKKPIVDIYNEIESINKLIPIKIGHLSEEKTVLQYIIDIGINSNNDWVVSNCGKLLLTIYRRYIGKNKLTIYEEVIEEIFKQVNIAFHKISKVNCLFLHDKEMDKYIPDLESLVRILKFLMPFLKSEYKFFFLFHDVTIMYMQIFVFFKEYLTHNIINDIAQAQGDSLSINEKKVKNVIYDITFLVLEGLLIICDNKRNRDKFYYETNNRYDLAEEIPNKNQLGGVVKELFSFINIFTEQIDIKTIDTKNIFVDKILLMTNKAIDIYITIASNFYGQNIILYEEFMSNLATLPNNGKPMINVNTFITKLTQIKAINSKNDKVYSLLESIAKFIIILFYDLNYYENESLYNKKNTDSNTKMLVLTETRLCSLIKLLMPNNTQLTMPIASNLPLVSKIMVSLIDLFAYYTTDNSDLIVFELTKLRSLLDNSSQQIDIIQVDIKVAKLPNARKINDICDLFSKYNEYYLTQSYGMNFPLQINSKGENNLTQMQLQQSCTMTDYKQQINEFEKLLNWKKQRIFLSKMDNLITRNSIVDLDTCMDSNMNYCLINEYDFFQLSKKYFYYNTDPFEQYYNTVLNEELIMKSFINMSYSVSSSMTNKLYVLSNEEEYSKDYEELFFRNLDAIKLEVESLKNDKEAFMLMSQNPSAHKIRKKINSKLNQFIYKPKYEKYIIKPPSQLINNKEQSRNTSKVSGRNLSTHVDNVVPGQKVVNLTYGGNPQAQPQIGVQPIAHEETKESQVTQLQPDELIKVPSNPMIPIQHTELNKPQEIASNIIPQQQPQPIPQGQIPPTQQPYNNPMMKMGQPFPYNNMPYAPQFVPGQTPNPMMMNQFSYPHMRPPTGMFNPMTQFPGQNYPQQMMPIGMTNPMQQQQQQPQQVAPVQLPPQQHQVPQQIQSTPLKPEPIPIIHPSTNTLPITPATTTPAPQRNNLMTSIENIMLQLKNNRANETSKDPRVRKKK